MPRSIEILVATDELPIWRKKIVRRVYQWVQTGPPSRGKKQPSTVYELKITLLGTKPPIWRRIETKDVTLRALHGLIQTSMGWTNSHLHRFEIDGTHYTDPRLMDDVFDVGGIYGFADYLEALADPGHEDHAGYLAWNGSFDPTNFDPAKATRAMRKGLPAW